MNGWMGQRLRIDMTNSTYEIERLPEEYYRKWIGGRGFNSDVVYHETYRGMDPYDPDNPLCIACGPLGGTFAPLSGRTTVSCRSPLTCSNSSEVMHGHGDTNMGGSFGPMMKYAGYDQIIVKGRAEKPTYLFINDDKIEFRDATHLWGKKSKEATKQILNELGDPDIRVLIIGPAGENLVRFSCVINSFSSAGGRTGMGAVMGSKNLKAIAVKGSKSVTVARPEEFIEKCISLRKKVHSSPQAIRRRYEGSLDLFDAGNNVGINAHKNCSTGYMKDIEKYYGGVVWAEQFLFRRKSCWSCPVGCGRYTYIKEGKWAGRHGGGPEMESLCIGPRIDSYDVAGVSMLCLEINDLGMDSISAGAVLSWLMEAFEKGYITEKDTDGLRLEWGDIEKSLEALYMMAYRKGFGELMAEGSLRLARKLGVGTDIVPHCRGLEQISVDPRIAKSFCLGYAISTRGSDHLRGYTNLEFPGCARIRGPQIDEALGDELAKIYWDKFPDNTIEDYDTKPQLCYWSERNKTVADLCGTCCQAIGSWGGAGSWREAYTPIFRPLTGADFSDEEIFLAAERVLAIERAHWLREGSGLQDDTHTERFFIEPVVDGPFKGSVIDRDKFERSVQEYYRIHGWDELGFITPEKAEALDLKEIIPDMEEGRAICEKWLKGGDEPISPQFIPGKFRE